MDEPRPSPRWHCDVCKGTTFGSAQEKARHFVSKRHAICLDNRHKADHRHQPLHGGGGGGGHGASKAGKTREEAERAKEMVALLKAQRAAANELHARQEAMLVRLQLLDEALNNCERRIAEKDTTNEEDDERGAWSEKKQKLFMGRIYGVLSAHGIEPDQVLNVYRWGSRWWGHYSPRSDYDFIVLVRDWDQPSTQNVLEGEEIDMAVYEVNIFQQLINQHVPWTCVFLSHPPEGILLERHKLHWEFRAHKWLGGVRKNMFKNYNIAKQYWQYGEIKRSKKRFIYVVKHWALSLQMAKTQKVTDRHAVNDLALSLMSMHFPNWKAFHQWYREYADTVETALKELTQSYKQFELDWWHQANATPEASGDDHRLVAVSYVNQNGFGELVKNLDVNVELVNASGEVSAVGGNDIDQIVAGEGTEGLVVLSSDKVGSPASARITFECHSGLVLARSSSPGARGSPTWRPIAQAFPRYRHLYPFHGSDKKRMEEDEVWTIIKAKQVGIEDLSDMDWSSAEAREMIDGHLGLLFYHSGKWCVQMKTRKDTSRADLVKEFWRLYAAQGITDKSLNTSWCYIFQLVSRRFPRFMKYQQDALVLVGVRDFGSSPLGREVDLDHALASQFTPADLATTAFCSSGEGGHDNATTAVGWRTPQRFPNLRDQESMVRKVRRQSPLSFKGLVISDPAPQAVTASASSAMMSASSCRRVVLSSPAYLWLAKLRALETWELEGDWDDEEGGEGEIDFAKERERCLFELMLLFMQWRSRQQTRTRRGEKGKWKRLRLQRRAPAADGDGDPQTTPSATTATSASATPTTTDEAEQQQEGEQEQQQDEQEEKEEAERDHEEERFLQLHEQYRADYLAVKATFIETCLQVDMRYTQLNRLFPSMKDWARECEKERYKPLLFVLKKRGFPSVRSFYTDYESMHEPRVEKVSYYILDYMHESAQTPQQATSTAAPRAGPTKPLYQWQG